MENPPSHEREHHRELTSLEQFAGNATQAIEDVNLRVETAIAQGTDSVRSQADGIRKRFAKKLIPISGILLSAFTQVQSARPAFPERFADRAIAERQLEENGITNAQAQTRVPVLSEFLADHIRPISVQDPAKQVLYALTEVITGKSPGSFSQAASIEQDNPRGVMAENNDAWRMYLGLSQEHNTFSISEYRPNKSTEDRYYYKINSFRKELEQLVHDNDFSKGIDREYAKAKASALAIKDPKERDSMIRMFYSDPEKDTPYISGFQRLIQKIDHSPNKSLEGTAAGMPIQGTAGWVMGHYNISLGTDEKGHYLAYYDKYNLETTPEGEDGVVGKPFEIYDRIYYNPETYEIL